MKENTGGGRGAVVGDVTGTPTPFWEHRATGAKGYWSKGLLEQRATGAKGYWSKGLLERRATVASTGAQATVTRQSCFVKRPHLDGFVKELTTEERRVFHRATKRLLSCGTEQVLAEHERVARVDDNALERHRQQLLRVAHAPLVDGRRVRDQHTDGIVRWLTAAPACALPKGGDGAHVTVM